MTTKSCQTKGIGVLLHQFVSPIVVDNKGINTFVQMAKMQQKKRQTNIVDHNV